MSGSGAFERYRRIVTPRPIRVNLAGLDGRGMGVRVVSGECATTHPLGGRQALGGCPWTRQSALIGIRARTHGAVHLSQADVTV